MKSIMMMIAILFVTNNYAQKEKKTNTINIQTTAECEECKVRIEDKLNFTKGIRYAELDMNTMKLEVSYSTKKISEAEIKQTLSDLGYDADEVKANQKAYEALPECCKKNAMDIMQNH